MGTPNQPKCSGAADRRERYRLSRETKIFVRAGGQTEVATIENMTRTGVYFVGVGAYEPGQSLDVIFPYDPAHPEAQKSQYADVMRVQTLPDSEKRGVAIKLLDMFLKP